MATPAYDGATPPADLPELSPPPTRNMLAEDFVPAANLFLADLPALRAGINEHTTFTQSKAQEIYNNAVASSEAKDAAQTANTDAQAAKQSASDSAAAASADKTTVQGLASQASTDAQTATDQAGIATEQADIATAKAAEATQIVTGDTPITALKQGDLLIPKDYVSVDANGALVKRNLTDDVNAEIQGKLVSAKDYVSVDANGALASRNVDTDISAKLAEGYESASLSRYDVDSHSTTSYLYLNNNQVFNVNSYYSRTLYFANVPASGRAMVVVVRLYSIRTTSTITWPTGINWAGGSAPTLEGSWMNIVLFHDAGNWYGTVGMKG